MNQLLKYTLLLFLVTFAACSNEDDAALIISNRQPQPGDALELTVSAADFVTDGAPDTRATDNDKTTTFGDGDRVGIIILDKDNAPIYNNIPYKYKNGKWTFDSNNDEGKGECYYDSKATTYIVYYPYSRAADGVTGVNDLKARFAPKFNQSDIEDYRSSDLMVWSNSSLTPPVKELNAELKHAYASVFLAPTVGKFKLEDGTAYTGSYTPKVSDISDVSLTIDNTVYIPYQTTDGTLRCIIPAGITPSGIRCFYTFGSKTYGNIINISGIGVVANTRYTSTPVIDTVPYSLGNANVGDFYCKKENGYAYLIPSDVSLSSKQKATCIGIVFKVGMDENDSLNDYDNLTLINGYVVALTDALEEICGWGERSDYSDTPLDNVYWADNADYNGYKNTKTIINVYNNSENWEYYQAFKSIIDYRVKVQAPRNSSDWYLPSLKQLADIYDLYQHEEGNILYDKLKGISDDCLFREAPEKLIYEGAMGRGGYWTSTECHNADAWFVRLTNGTREHYGKGQRYCKDSYVRAILTF